jgi:hypothetical protein
VSAQPQAWPPVHTKKVRHKPDHPLSSATMRTGIMAQHSPGHACRRITGGRQDMTGRRVQQAHQGVWCPRLQLREPGAAEAAPAPAERRCVVDEGSRDVRLIRVRTLGGSY